MNKYLTQIGATTLNEIWTPGRAQKERWVEVPLPRGAKNGDKVRIVLRGNVAERYVNGVRKADWRIPASKRRG